MAFDHPCSAAIGEGGSLILEIPRRRFGFYLMLLVDVVCNHDANLCRRLGDRFVILRKHWDAYRSNHEFLPTNANLVSLAGHMLMFYP